MLSSHCRPQAASVLQILLLLLSLVMGCSKDEPEKKPPKPKVFSSEERIHHVLAWISRALPGEKWVFYQEVKRRLPYGTKRFPVYGFISKKSNPGSSAVVVSKTRYVDGERPVVAFKKLPGIVDEVFILRLGADPKTHLLLTKTHKKQDGRVFTTTTFWDFSSMKLDKVWTITSSYDPDYRETYNPPEFHYWDNNDDGVREVILTNSWADKSKPPAGRTGGRCSGGR